MRSLGTDSQNLGRLLANKQLLCCKNAPMQNQLNLHLRCNNAYCGVRVRGTRQSSTINVYVDMIGMMLTVAITHSGQAA